MPNTMEQPQRHRSSTSTTPGNHSNSGSGSISRGLERDSEESRRMLPCRFFTNGFCHRGNRCRFYHPVTMANILRVPSLPSGFEMEAFSTRLGEKPLATPSRSMNKRIGSRPQSRTYMDEQVDGYDRRRSRGTPSLSPGGSTSLLHTVLEQTQTDVDGVLAKNVNGLVVYEYDSPISTSQDGLPTKTLFDHIDWENFLAPGQQPPPIYNLPEDGGFGTPIDVVQLIGGKSSDDALAHHEHDEVDQNITPETMALHSDDPEPDGSTPKKLSAKEELQMKVKEIAKALATEPQPSVRPMDSFFKQFANFDMLPESMLIRTGPIPCPRESEATTAHKDDEMTKECDEDGTKSSPVGSESTGSGDVSLCEDGDPDETL